MCTSYIIFHQNSMQIADKVLRKVIIPIYQILLSIQHDIVIIYNLNDIVFHCFSFRIIPHCI